jgi:pectate lyase
MMFTMVVVALSAIAAAQVDPKLTPKAMSAKDDAWFAGEEGLAAIDNMISWQTDSGGWPKGYKLDRPRKPEEKGQWGGVATFDNGLTHTEIRLLARSYRIKPRPVVLASINRGIDFLLSAQYANGGYPQRVPPPNTYAKHITFNDGVMTSVLRLLRDIADSQEFAFVDDGRRAKARQAFDRGIDCILKSQVIVDGRPTGWCAQHHMQTLEPVGGRSFELVSLSGWEGASIVLLLMEIENPTPEIRRAIEGAVAWFERVKIIPAPTPDNPNPEPQWARFYEIGTDRPIFADRDGVKVYSLDEIDKERVSGYRWFGNWGIRVREKYVQWSAKYGATPTTQPR